MCGLAYMFAYGIGDGTPCSCGVLAAGAGVASGCGQYKS